MILQLGEVVLIRMQFHQASAGKIRPALALLDTADDDFIAAPITSQARSTQYDLLLPDWQAARLNVVSWVRIHKLTVLMRSEVLRKIGVLSARDRESLHNLLCDAFCPLRVESS